jgi:hypothetical protein
MHAAVYYSSYFHLLIICCFHCITNENINQWKLEILMVDFEWIVVGVDNDIQKHPHSKKAGKK